MRDGIFFEKQTPENSRAVLRDDVPSMNALRGLAWANPGSSFEGIKLFAPCEKKVVSGTGEEYVEDVGYGPTKALSDWNGYGTLCARKEQFANAVAAMIAAGEEPQILDALYERLGHILIFCENEKKSGTYSDLEHLIAGRDAVAATWILATGLPSLKGATQIVDDAKCRLVSFEFGPRDFEFVKALARLVNYIWNATPVESKFVPATSDIQPAACPLASTVRRIEQTEPLATVSGDVQMSARQIVLGKEDILEALGLEEKHWDFVRRLSHKQNGPIIVARGEKPRAEKAPLLIWWNKNELWDENFDERNKKVPCSLTLAKREPKGSAVPEVGGHLKRAKSSKGK